MLVANNRTTSQTPKIYRDFIQVNYTSTLICLRACGDIFFTFDKSTMGCEAEVARSVREVPDVIHVERIRAGRHLHRSRLQVVEGVLHRD